MGLDPAAARVNRHHLISREQLSVRDQMSRVLRMVRPGIIVEFTTLFRRRRERRDGGRDVSWQSWS
jgi:chromatin segregation and condensation protein Rec8/ScpA/Scc1 (kleisin family)